jgi:hypothetical protein
MNYQEMREFFSVLYNNITSNQAPGLNDYEMSVFLTKGQDEKLKNYFLPQSNEKQAGFDGNQKRQIDFSSITKSSSVTSFSSPLFDSRANSKSAALPSDLWIIINERVDVTREGKTEGLVVKPISYDEYDRLMAKPYKRPVRYEAWRLINNDTANKSDLIVGPADVITKYNIRYLRRPKPIIVGDLDGLTIDGYTFGTGTGKTQGCELDPLIHEEIVQRAVELAKIAWTATGQDNAQMMIQAGQRSE